MNIDEAMKVLTNKLSEDTVYYEVWKANIREQFIIQYASKAINLPTSDFLFCPTSSDVIEIADNASDQFLQFLLNDYEEK